MSSLPEIFISSPDARELDRLLADAGDSTRELGAKLFDAHVVAPEALPHGTVCLRAAVTYEELPARVRRRVTLVHPDAADASAGRISVLSPVGRALLGHRIGRVVDVPLPGGHSRTIHVVDVSPPPAIHATEPAWA